MVLHAQVCGRVGSRPIKFKKAPVRAGPGLLLYTITSMTTDERLDRLTGIVDTLAGSVTAHDSILTAHDSIIEALAKAASAHSLNIEAHDRQLGVLLKLAEESRVAIDKLRESSADLERRWQAYLNTLRRQ